MQAAVTDVMYLPKNKMKRRVCFLPHAPTQIHMYTQLHGCFVMCSKIDKQLIDSLAQTPTTNPNVHLPSHRCPPLATAQRVAIAPGILRGLLLSIPVSASFLNNNLEIHWHPKARTVDSNTRNEMLLNLLPN